MKLLYPVLPNPTKTSKSLIVYFLLQNVKHSFVVIQIKKRPTLSEQKKTPYIVLDFNVLQTIKYS